MSNTVYVNISCYYGYSLDAKHYYVRISSHRAGGEVYRSKFDTYEQATAYAREIVGRHFPSHDIESTGESRFVYTRQGD